MTQNATNALLQTNTAGGKWSQKLKSRTLWIVTGALTVASIPLFRVESGDVGIALGGYAAVITALAGFSVFNKRQEALITYKSNELEVTKDTRAGGDTTVVSGITGNVTHI